MSDRTIPEYVDMLQSSDPDERREAVVFLTRHNDPEMLRHIEPLAADPDAAVRYYVKKSLASLQARARQTSEPPAPKIDRGAREQIEAIQAIVEAGDREQVEVLSGQLAIEENRFVRATLIKALGQLGDVRVASLLVPHLKDEDSRVVANTVEALEQIGDPESQVAMLELLTHPDTRVKGNVAKALWTCSRTDTIGSTLILDRLREMLESDKPWYRESAVFVLGRIGTGKALSLVRIALGDADDHIRTLAEEIIAEKSGDESTGSSTTPAAAPVKVPAPVREERLERLVHVTSGHDNADEGLLAVWLRRIWDTERSLQENLMTSGLLLVFAMTGLFVVLVAVNLAMLIAGPAVTPVSKIVAVESSRTQTVERLALAGRWEKVLPLLSTAMDLTDRERILLEQAYIFLQQLSEQSGNINGARRLLTSWNSALPDSVTARIRLGEFLLKYEGEIAAEEYFQRAAAMDPQSAEAQLGLGDVAFMSGNTKEARTFYDKARQLSPENPRVIFACGNIRAHDGDLSAAETLFRNAIRVDPLFSLARYGLARVRLRQGDKSSARQELERVVSLSPSLVTARLELARLLADVDQGNAVEHYRELLTLIPDDLAIRREFSHRLFDWKLHEASLQEADEVLKRQADDADMLALSGAACLSLDRPAEAMDRVEKSIRLQPDNGQARYHRALLREAASDYEGAAEDYQVALAGRYEPRACYMNLAQLQRIQSRLGDALKIIEEGLEAFPEDPLLLYNRGVMLYLLDRKDDARGVFLKLAAWKGPELLPIMDRIRFFMSRLGISASNEKKQDSDMPGAEGETR